MQPARIKHLKIGVAVAGGILLLATALTPQMPALPAVGEVWEYSSVTGSPFTVGTDGTGSSVPFVSRATICYAVPSGCRGEQVTTSVPNQRQGADAMMMASARLGEKGWQLTAVTDGVSESGAGRVFYFRRLRSVLNRSEQPR